MPIYEFQCKACLKNFQYLILKKEEQGAIVCPNCGKNELKRLISRTIYHVSEGDRLREYNPSVRQDDSFYKDTRNIGLHAKKRAMEMGVDLGESFEAKLDKLRTDPKSVLDQDA